MGKTCFGRRELDFYKVIPSMFHVHQQELSPNFTVLFPLSLSKAFLLRHHILPRQQSGPFFFRSQLYLAFHIARKPIFVPPPLYYPTYHVDVDFLRL